jgi:hypothetical protein
MEIVSFYSENNIKPTYTLCEKNADSLNIKACGIYIYHLALKH